MRKAVAILLVCLPLVRAAALEEIRLESGTESVSVGGLLAVFEDPTRALDWTDARARITEFKPPVSHNLNFGYTRSAYWLYGRIRKAPGVSDGRFFLETDFPWFSRFDLFVIGPDGSVSRQTQVKKQPFADRSVRNRNFVFALDLPEGLSELLVRVEGNPLRFHLRVTEKDRFIGKSNTEYYAFGVYYGIVVFLIIVSFVLYVGIREKVYFFNILFMASTGLLQFTLNGLSFQYLWPNALAWHEISTNFLPGLSFLFGLVLARNFLQSRTNTPVLNVFLRILMAVCVLNMACALLGLTEICLVLINILMIGIPVLFIAMGSVCLKKKYLPARYFLIAFLMMALSLVVFALKDMGVLPSVFVTEYGTQIGILGQMIFLGLAMLDRITQAIREKARLQEDMKNRLEGQVRERTRELQDKQDEINRDLDQASAIQQSTLPRAERIIRDTGMDIDAVYLPMNGKTSGDYYSVWRRESTVGNCLSVLIADATGHGIQAALTTMQFDLINKQAPDFRFPHERLEFLNRSLIEMSADQNFYTGFIADIYEDKLFYASAGHPEQYLIRAGSRDIIRLKTTGKPLGLFPHENYEMQAEDLDPRDVLLLFSDGLIEETNSREEEYGGEALVRMLGDWMDQDPRCPQSCSMRDMTRKIMDGIVAFRGDRPFRDDITLIAVRAGPLENSPKHAIISP